MQLGLVTVDREDIVAIATLDGGRVIDAITDIGDTGDRSGTGSANRAVDIIDHILGQILQGRIEDHLVGQRISDDADDDRGGIEHITGLDLGIDIAQGTEHLADLEAVRTVTAIERGQAAVVIDGEVVVTAETIDGQVGIDIFIVIDPFDTVEVAVAAGIIQQGNEIMA